MLTPIFFLAFIGSVFCTCTWKAQQPGKVIVGYNDKRIDDISLQECVAACESETDFLCLSVEHYDGEFGLVCYLSTATSYDAEMSDFDDYIYVERDCPINRPHSCFCMGDPHCYSFDRRMAHFMGTCFYTMSRDNCENNYPAGDPTWEVVVNMDKRHPNHYVSFVTHAIINLFDFGLSIELFRDFRVLVNGDPVLGFPNDPHPQVTITKTPSTIYVTTARGIQVTWLPSRWSITVNAPEHYQSKMCGLCGDANANRNNDWTIGDADICLPDAFPEAVQGAITSNVFEFGYSWTKKLDENEQQCLDLCPTPPVVQTCPEAKKQLADEHCSPISDPNGPFQQCLNVLSEDEKANFAENCNQDACFMDDYDNTICNSAAELARYCKQLHQVEVQWRSETLCPLECGEGMTFKACGSICLPTCSDMDATGCGDTETCEEGCFCEEGLIYDGEGSCFDSEQCGCAVPDQGGVFVSVNTTFLTENCVQQCSCNEPQSDLACVEFSCPENEVCTSESGERTCECQAPNVVQDDQCIVLDDCELPVDSGTGSKSLTRYYWNPTKEKCKEFTYNGQGGNANNFKTKKACKDRCGEQEFPDLCQLPKDKGTGTESLTRFYYKADTNKCKKMTYLGSGGNANNFETKAECRAACK